MEVGDQYGLPDLRRLLTRRTHFSASSSLPLPSDPYLAHRNMALPVPYHDAAPAYMLSNGIPMPSGLLRFSPGTTAAFTASASAGDGGGCGWSLGNFDGGNSRWPRQETLILLEIRSRLDSKFKEANMKGPLWDEISRIMAEEYGYMRSGKKCREKFENLYKYYKKTKEGKAGRQDGKNYRFFKQLEAIYDETSNLQSLVPETNIHVPPQESMQEQRMSESLSLSESEDSSSQNMDDEENDELSTVAFTEKRPKGWKMKKVKDFVDSQMKRLIDSQDVWMERMLKVIEEKEKERVSKEEEWRRREAARFEKEHEFWVKERAWIEARDAALMAAVRKLGKTQNEINANRWNEHQHEFSSLEQRFQENNMYSKQSMSEEMEAKMVSLGYEREANNAECYKKRKEDYFQQLDAIDGQENKSFYSAKQMDSSSSPSSSYDINSFHISAVNQGDEWDRYGLKMMDKGKNQQI